MIELFLELEQLLVKFSICGLTATVPLFLISIICTKFKSRVELFRKWWKGCSYYGKIVVSFFFFEMVVYGATKMLHQEETRKYSLHNATEPHFVEMENWYKRGAWLYSDEKVEFKNSFVFPFGTNHLSSVIAVSHGKVKEGYFTTNAIADIGVNVAMAPGKSRFKYQYLPSSIPSKTSYMFRWDDVLIDRDSSRVIDASIQLFRNGDALIITNGVERYIPRELPFEHDGFGQDEDWIVANFTNATEILSKGYENWVNEQVGAGLENGLYKLIVTVPETPPETTKLCVGDYSLAVTNEGEYVFLLEKGIKYPISVFPQSETNFIFEAFDDLEQWHASYSVSSFVFPERYCEWSEDIGNVVIVPPTHNKNGFMLFKPILSVSPKWWNPSWKNQTCVFTAELRDIKDYIPRTYQWDSLGADVEVKSMTGKTAEFTCNFPYAESDVISLWLETMIADEKLEVEFRCPVFHNVSCDYEDIWTEGVVTNSLPDVVSIAATPEVLIFDESDTDELRADIVCFYQVHNSGKITLSIEHGSNCVVKDYDGNIVQNGYSWNVQENSWGVKCFSVKGIDKSPLATGTNFKVIYSTNSNSQVIIDSTNVAMYQVNTVATSLVQPQNRRNLGVREKVSVYITPLPEDVSVESEVEEGSVVRINKMSNQWIYTAPACKTNDLVRLSVGDVNYFVPFEIYEPTGFTILQIEDFSFTNKTGVAGCYELIFSMQLMPTNVSWTAVETIEIGNVATNATGYFHNPLRLDWLDHSNHGADEWINSEGIIFDEAGINCECPPPWGIGGSFSWEIPIYWRIRNNPDKVHYLELVKQTFKIDTDGTFYVSKFGYTGVCSTNRVHYIEKKELGL